MRSGNTSAEGNLQVATHNLRINLQRTGIGDTRLPAKGVFAQPRNAVTIIVRIPIHRGTAKIAPLPSVSPLSPHLPFAAVA